MSRGLCIISKVSLATMWVCHITRVSSHLLSVKINPTITIAHTVHVDCVIIQLECLL